MTIWLSIGEWLLVVAVTIGMAVWLATLVCAFSFRARGSAPRTASSRALPPVTLFKPVYGLEKNLRENLRTACLQAYPEYQVVFSVQRQDDPAIPILRELEREFGRELVTVVVENVEVGFNGKINNLAGAMPHARHDVLVVSDSDVRLRSDFLERIVAPLADPSVGAVTTFFKATGAARWYEKLELLTLNADQSAIAIFARAARVQFCFGASTALRRRTLERIGGFAAFGHSLVEDSEMGRAIQGLGQRLVAIPYVVDTTVDLRSPAEWIKKQIYWDQNTIAAMPGVYAACLCLRVIPLALLYAALRGGDAIGLGFFAVALVVRLASAAVALGVGLGDREGLRALWLVPIKDVLGIVWVLRAAFARTVTWRGVELSIGAGGRLSPAPARVPAAERAS
jgi:ceramide glucosyltransferase